MAGQIIAGQDIVAADFVTAAERNATATNDSGRVPKFESDGKLSRVHFRVAFGGTGSDGALSISSGTTTVNLANAKIVILNYTSISITGSGKLAFSNPHATGTVIVIKCQGNATLTSSATPMIDCSNTGAAGGTSAVRTVSGSSTSGGNGGDGNCDSAIITHGAVSNSGGVVATLSTAVLGPLASLPSQVFGRYPKMFIGSGGSGGTAHYYSGSGGTVQSGAGGNGGGCLIMEIGGAINFTTTNGISVSGQNGSNGAISGTANGRAAAGGGAGSGGSCFIYYNTVTAFTGTVAVGGAVGGVTATESGLTASGGGSGGGILLAGNIGINTTTNITSGGAGVDGLEVHGLNTEFV